MDGNTSLVKGCLVKHSREQFLALNSVRLVSHEGKKKEKKRKKTTTIPRKTAVSMLDKGDKNSTLTVVLPPNALVAAIQQIIIRELPESEILSLCILQLYYAIV